jgi:2-amino-4-hydroxy-6-hydroxymethyldihydropteridine diphosphokinase
VVLPHPEMHRRAFVLLPLQEIAPFWRHPRLGQSVATLLSRISARERAGVHRVLDSPGATCEKSGK